MICKLNISVVPDTFPAAWKHSIVIPIFKSGESNDASNYRHFSLLPVLWKMFEKVVASQINEHLEENRLLSYTQHGFRADVPIQLLVKHQPDCMIILREKK